MGLLGGIIGTAAGAIGGIFGANAANKGYNEAIKMYEGRMSDIKAHRDKLYYQDPTQSAAAQGAQTKAKEILDEQTKEAVAGQAVTGGTDESIALQKQAAAKAVTDMIAGQASQGEQQKEQAYQDAENQIDQMTQYIASTKMQKAQQNAQAITGAAGALSSVAGNLPF